MGLPSASHSADKSLNTYIDVKKFVENLITNYFSFMEINIKQQWYTYKILYLNETKEIKIHAYEINKYF